MIDTKAMSPFNLKVDKVRVLPVGSNANYENYVIVENKTFKVYIVNPLNLIKLIQIPYPEA